MISREQKCNIYHRLLEKQKEDGFIESYKVLYFEYKELLSEINWISEANYWIGKLWWNWGYNKEWVLLFTMSFFLVFYVFNIVYRTPQEAYPLFLNKQVSDEQSSEKEIKHKYWKPFVFTLVIMFGFTSNIENLKIEYKGALISIAVMYLVGKICIVYLINFVLMQ